MTLCACVMLMASIRVMVSKFDIAESFRVVRRTLSLASGRQGNQ